jgi:predicted Ser/Thr protein kinase
LKKRVAPVAGVKEVRMAMAEPALTWRLLIGACCLLLPVALATVAIVVAVATRRGTPDHRSGDGGRHAKPRARAARAGPATGSSRCPECGTDLPADAPEGLCPQCLLKGVISSAHNAAQASSPEQTAAYAGQSAAPSVAELAPLFPQLEIIELIGQGGMGAVYKARQPALERLVAVKVLPREAGQDPAFAERFHREARTLARLGHPNIVGIYDVGRAGDLYYFVMEYVDGANLRQVLHDGQLTPEQALRIVPQICDALQYAHEEGVVHRDIKPENILLDRKGRVKIADFGLAKLLGRDAGNFTLTGSRQVMGTLYYMAPEQVERPLEVDHRADIYSLGVVFYEMLTGQLPVGRFPLPSEKAGTDAFLDDVVLHALEREPARRYQHASEVKTDVEAPARRTSPPASEVGPDDREVARHQVRGPATGLMAMAVIAPLGWFVAFMVYTLFLYLDSADRMGGNSWFWAGLDKGYGPFLILFALNAIVGGFLIVGAAKMKRLETYEFAIISSLMTGLQIAPTLPISVIMGGWALWVLRKPEVKAAFAQELRRRVRGPAGRRRPPTPPAGVPGRPVPRMTFRGFLSSVTPWAVLCCVIGLVEGSLASWLDVYAEGIAPQGLSAAEAGWQQVNKQGPLVAVAGQFRIDGGETWQGGTGAAICVILLVFLIATASLDPVPVWRPLIVVAGAVTVLSTSALFLLRFQEGKIALSQKFAATYPRIVVSNVVAMPNNGPYVVCLAALVLLALGTVQLYRGLRAPSTAGSP